MEQYDDLRLDTKKQAVSYQRDAGRWYAFHRTLLCALDRIFDEATVFKLRGESFRGKKLDTVSVQTGKVKAIEPMADQQE